VTRVVQIFVLFGGALAVLYGAQKHDGWLTLLGIVLCLIVALGAIAQRDVEDPQPTHGIRAVSPDDDAAVRLR